MARGLRHTVLLLTIWTGLAQACGPAPLGPPPSSLAADLLGRYPRVLPGPLGGPAVLLAAAAPAQSATADLEAARRLARNGETAAARQAFARLLDRDPGVAAAARLDLARLALEEGDSAQAIGHLQVVLREYPQRAERVPATYLMALAERQQGNLAEAITRLEEYLALSDLLAAYARLRLADWYAAAGAPERGVAEAQRALEAPASRRVRIEALEYLARAAAERGDLATAQARWEAIWPLAVVPAYRAEVLWQLAELARARGDLDGAAGRYRTLVVEYATTRRAVDALERLNRLERDDLISHYQAGLVRYHQGQHARALAGFEAQLAAGGSDDELAGASYYRALALLRLGRESAGREALAEMAASFPASTLAPPALYRVGRLLEDAERYTEAADTYRTLIAAYPDSPAGQLALFRAGYALRRAGAFEDALAAWAEALPLAADSVVDAPDLGQRLNPRAAVLYWTGKTLALVGRAAEARAAWQEVVANGGDDYHTLRARVALAGSDGAPATSPAVGSLAPPAPDAALGDWLARHGAPDAKTLATELAADPAWRRGAALWALGRTAEAAWEFVDLRDRFADDPPRLYALSVALRDLGADHLALRVAERLRVASGVRSVQELPRAVRALLFPTPYADLVQTYGARFGVDPLLLYALMRQESAFNPRAESSARARGLTQVIPATAREIVRQLGRGPLSEDDLFRPAVSIELGAYYLAQALRRFNGDVFPALAGYNAGPGNAARWLRQPGASDADVFAEQIPYSETYHYVRYVWTYYQLYRDLYNG